VIEPVWSPDGTSLALGTSATQYDPPEQTLLYQFDLNANHLSALPGSERLWSPRWSPDGRYLAALEFPETIIKLYDLKMHTQTQLQTSPRHIPAGHEMVNLCISVAILQMKRGTECRFATGSWNGL
jgi:Tol biopolymer transport system component